MLSFFSDFFWTSGFLRHAGIVESNRAEKRDNCCALFSRQLLATATHHGSHQPVKRETAAAATTTEAEPVSRSHCQRTVSATVPRNCRVGTYAVIFCMIAGLDMYFIAAPTPLALMSSRTGCSSAVGQTSGHRETGNTELTVSKCVKELRRLAKGGQQHNVGLALPLCSRTCARRARN